MGTPVLEDWPEYEDAKHYCVTFHVFQTDGNPDTCDGDFISECKVCMSGADIKAFHDNGDECKDLRRPCDPGLVGNHRMICATGPYDLLEDCRDNCVWPPLP